MRETKPRIQFNSIGWLSDSSCSSAVAVPPRVAPSIMAEPIAVQPLVMPA
jgi:hypothetical protein